MRYIFFDVECSNHFNGGKICELGYVITDENFCVLKKADILINPGNNRSDRFALLGRKNHKDLHLAYEANNYEAYYKAKVYSEHYDNIRYLFTQKNVIYFGFSCKNDKSDITFNNIRSGHADFSFDAIDVQKLLSIYKDGIYGKQNSLEKTFYDMFSNISCKNLIPHRPVDDSMMTMLILKKICEDLEMTVNDLITHFPNSIIYHDSLRNEKESHESKCEINKKCDFILKELYEEQKKINIDENSKKTFITISSKLKKDTVLLEQIIKKIKDKNYLYVLEVKDSNIFLVKDKYDMNRLENILVKPYDGIYIFLDEFLLS